MTFCPKEQQFEEAGEVRCPMQGEWFLGSNGKPHESMINFKHQQLPILRKIEPTAEEVKSDELPQSSGND